MRPPSLFFALLLVVLTSPTPTNAESPPYFEDNAYDEGSCGGYPVQKYYSSDAIAPHTNTLQESLECDTSLLTFLSPRGYSDEARNPRAVILDSTGSLVWSSGWDGKQIYNLRAQRYKGNDYITFWAGNDAVGGHGAGHYYMLDRSYTLVYTISAANGLEGDLHEFLITDQDTALMTVYQAVEHDLTSLGKSTGPIWDCLIQEIDIDTGDLLFEWRAADHLNVSDTYRPIGGEGEPNGAAFDWFHINSIDKDSEGNYLISSRYLHSVTRINGRTGEIMWILGGKSNMFTDLSGGNATDFAFQHDARWTNDYTEVTLFDNSDDGSAPNKAQPRGLRIRINETDMSATLLTEYKNSQKFTAASQGSMQNLDNGNVLVGFGYSAAYTEFDHDGEILCDTHFGPQSEFGTGGVQSYRVLKFPWQGEPITDPDLVVAKDDAGIWRAYMSWNGATEISEWVLQGTNVLNDSETDSWEPLAKSQRTTFETSIALEEDHPRYLRAVALDWMSNIIGESQPVNSSMVDISYKVMTGKNGTKTIFYLRAVPTWMLATTALGTAVLAIGVCLRPVVRAWKRYHAGHGSGKYRALAGDEIRLEERLA